MMLRLVKSIWSLVFCLIIVSSDGLVQLDKRPRNECTYIAQTDSPCHFVTLSGQYVTIYPQCQEYEDVKLQFYPAEGEAFTPEFYEHFLNQSKWLQLEGLDVLQLTEFNDTRIAPLHTLGYPTTELKAGDNCFSMTRSTEGDCLKIPINTNFQSCDVIKQFPLAYSKCETIAVTEQTDPEKDYEPLMNTDNYTSAFPLLCIDNTGKTVLHGFFNSTFQVEGKTYYSWLLLLNFYESINDALKNEGRPTIPFPIKLPASPGASSTTTEPNTTEPTTTATPSSTTVPTDSLSTSTDDSSSPASTTEETSTKELPWTGLPFRGPPTGTPPPITKRITQASQKTKKTDAPREVFHPETPRAAVTNAEIYEPQIPDLRAGANAIRPLVAFTICCVGIVIVQGLK